jgi:hypothetical protein
VNKDCQLIYEVYQKFNPAVIKTIEITRCRGYTDVDNHVGYETPGCSVKQFAPILQKRLRKEFYDSFDPEDLKTMSKCDIRSLFEFHRDRMNICHDAVDIEAGEENSILILGSGCDVWYCIEDIASGKVDDKTFEEFVKFTRSGKIGPHLQTCIMVRKKFNKNTPEDQQTAADLLDV